MIQLWRRWLPTLGRHSHPRRLRIRGRAVLPCSAFGVEDLDDLDNIKIETIRFPDFSCNWSRFSIAADVRLRENCRSTDGAYAFTVETARYKSLATPVHDPLGRPVENYAHVEVRELQEGESVLEAPPKNRTKKKFGKSRRLEYRQNLLNRLCIELPAKNAAT
jgi:hypothetical protein